MEQNKDAPAVVRRRRKVARQQREQTPESSKIGKLKYSDDDSSSTTNTVSRNSSIREPPTIVTPPNIVPPILPERKIGEAITGIPSSAKKRDPATIGGHLSKILSRRDKKLASPNVRSLSSPREDQKDTINLSDVRLLMREARRSLSTPR